MVDRTLDARTARGGGTYATGVDATTTAVARPALMFAQAVPHMRTSYTIRADSVQNIKAVIGVDKGGFKAAGEVAIEGTSGFESGKQLLATKKTARKAILIQPELAITSQYTCYRSYNPYFGSYLDTGKCVTESSGRWSGDVGTEKTPFQACSAGPSSLLHFSNRSQLFIATHDGVKYSSTVSMGAMGNSLAVTAVYGSGTEVRLDFDQGGKKHKFCAGGDTSLIADAAKLYVNLRDKPDVSEPCGRQGRCRSAH